MRFKIYEQKAEPEATRYLRPVEDKDGEINAVLCDAAGKEVAKLLWFMSSGRIGRYFLDEDLGLPRSENNQLATNTEPLCPK